MHGELTVAKMFCLLFIVVTMLCLRVSRVVYDFPGECLGQRLDSLLFVVRSSATWQAVAALFAVVVEYS